MKHGYWVVLYDICDPKRLRRIEKIVSQYGIRVQKSVFEIDADEKIINQLQKKMKVIVREDDFVAIIPLCETDWQKSEKYGKKITNGYIEGNYAIL